MSISFHPSRSDLTPSALIQELGSWGRTPTPGRSSATPGPTPTVRASSTQLDAQIQEIANQSFRHLPKDGSYAAYLEAALKAEWGLVDPEEAPAAETQTEPPTLQGNGSFEEMMRMD